MAVASAALAAIGPILTIASTAIALVGVGMTASANARAAEFEAAQAERNRTIQLRNAERAIVRSQEEQMRQDQAARALLGQQVAAQSASGLALEGRSQMLTRKSARQLARQDAANIREAGEIDAANFRMLAEDAGAQADFSRSRASNAILAGWIEGAGVAVGGLSSLIKPQGSLLGKTKVPRAQYA